MPLTVQQRRVLCALLQAEGPLTAYALLARLRGNGFSAPTQVYRALDRLLKTGRVHRLATMPAYVACRDKPENGPGFRACVICDACGQVQIIAGIDLYQGLQQWLEREAFRVQQCAIELHGCCARCAVPDSDPE